MQPTYPPGYNMYPQHPQQLQQPPPYGDPSLRYVSPQPLAASGPVIMQPAPSSVNNNNNVNTNSTTVVVNANLDGYVDDVFRDWTTGVFAIFSDAKICGCVMCCYTCAMCDIATRMNESCCVGCCNLSVGFVPLCIFPVGSLALRVKLRTKYNIKGTILDDMLCLMCCNSCTTCQLMREMEKLKVGRV